MDLHITGNTLFLSIDLPYLIAIIIIIVLITLVRKR